MRSLALLVLLLAGPAAAAGPRLVAPGLVSTGDSDSHAILSPDGSRLYWLKLSPDFARWTVVAAARIGTGWGEPEIAWFSGRWSDGDVSFSPDGATIYFVSNRPDRPDDPPRADTDIFRMRRTPTGWSTPERLVSVSSPGNEWYPNATADGTLYFGSERREGNLGPEGTSDLWRARAKGGEFATPENLGMPINSPEQEIEPWISADGRTLVFAAKNRAGGSGSYDLFVSRARDGAWTPPRPLGGGVNSPAWDFGPRFSPDGATFYFGSARLAPDAADPAGAAGYLRLLERLRSPGNGLFDVYEVEARELGLDPR